jgi:hypothetical protein
LNIALGTTIMVKCFEADSHSSMLQDNKLFEVASTIKYPELQEIVNKKYGNSLTQLSYIDEQDE